MKLPPAVGSGAKLCHVATGGRMVAVVTTMGQVTSYAKDGPGLAMDTVDGSERNPSLRNFAMF